jgi:hypothetical protein
MTRPLVHLLAGCALALIAVPTLTAQSAAHLGVRGVVHSSRSAVGDPVGASAQLDFAARQWLDVRFSYGVSRGSYLGFAACDFTPGGNCLPVERRVDTRLSTVSVALPLRLGRRAALEWRLVPRLDGHGIDGTGLVGASLGLEARYRRTPDSRLEFLASADVSGTSELPATADRPSFDGALQRFSLGARYRFYTRR